MLTRGQLALRKLYHESERLLVVLYTSPTCGPCRTLKPIFSKVAEEFSGKVQPGTRLCLPCATLLLLLCTHSSAVTMLLNACQRRPSGLCSYLCPMVLPQLHLVEIDIEEDPEIAQAGGINGTPTVQIFKNKERLHHLPGVKMKREYRQLIESNL